MAHTVRIWDLPTRLFHWALAASVVALVITAKVGGNAMVWHERLGYVVLTLLLFRMIWGVMGGRWSRFGQFVYSPQRLWRYLQGRSHPEDHMGHSPLGALSVFALLLVLIAQVLTGLISNDEIAFTGPLNRFVSSALASQATGYHKDIGQYLLLALLALHLCAVAYYVLVRKQALVRAMVQGDKQLPVAAAASRDDAPSRWLALAVLAACAALSWWISTLGAGGF